MQGDCNIHTLIPHSDSTLGVHMFSAADASWRQTAVLDLSDARMLMPPPYRCRRCQDRCG
eukprot:162263-Chlamydomonas_euryale.AAC.3